MSDLCNLRRRAILANTAAVLAAAPLLAGRAHAKPPTPGVRAAPNRHFESLKTIDAGDLRVTYAVAGPADGRPVLLLHGWPYDIHTYADVTALLADAGYRVIVPYLRGYGPTRFLSAHTPRNGQPAALASDALALLDALGIAKAIVGGCDWGARTACILAALWPERCKALVSVSGYLIGSQVASAAPLPPEVERQWWYQFYFATEHGKAGYAANTHAFARLIWKLASPRWEFDEATFVRSAAAFENPDHVAITVHNYRWRLRLAEGEARYQSIEDRLAAFPAIRVPTITLEGDANDAPHPSPESYAKRFLGRYEHRLITGGIGHNLPQEAPADFAQAIVDVDRMG